jgi:hypothetical protein
MDWHIAAMLTMLTVPDGELHLLLPLLKIVQQGKRRWWPLLASGASTSEQETLLASVERIAEEELPSLCSLASASACTLAQICFLWLDHCFFGHLPMDDIVKFLTLPLIYGQDYQAFEHLRISVRSFV